MFDSLMMFLIHVSLTDEKSPGCSLVIWMQEHTNKPLVKLLSPVIKIAAMDPLPKPANK